MAMYYLPKANPLYEQISTSKIIISDIFEKLIKGNFTGYLQHTAPQCESFSVFASGIMIGCANSYAGIHTTGSQAVPLMFRQMTNTVGEINVYRMTADIAMCSHALLQGNLIYKNDDVRQVDIKTLLAKLKNAGLCGVVRFSTQERHSMLFFKTGQSIGFYHDGAKTIDNSPEESRKVAALPGARVDVYSTRPLEDLLKQNLLPLESLAAQLAAAKTAPAPATTKPDQNKPLQPALSDSDQKKLAELIEDLQDVAMAYLSKEGRKIIDMRLQEAGGDAILFNREKTLGFLKSVSIDALKLDTPEHTEEMITLMKSEISERLAL